MTSNFYSLFEIYLCDKLSLYKSKEKQLCLLSSFKDELLLEEENFTIGNSLLKYLSDKRDKLGFDFYLDAMIIVGFYHFGNIKKGAKNLDQLIMTLQSLKKNHRIIELVELFKSFNLSEKKIESIMESVDLYFGHVEKRKKYSDETLLKLDFSEIKLNSSIYLRNTYILEKYVSSCEVYPSLDALESILKALPEISIDGLFLKSCTKLAFEIKSKPIASAIIKVLERQGKTLGINIDKLNALEETMYNKEEQNNEAEDIEINLGSTIKRSLQPKLFQSDDIFEMAKNLRESGSQLQAIAIYREYLFLNELDNEIYNNVTYEIACCYEEMGDFKTAVKLYSHINRRAPNFRRVLDRIEKIG